MQAGPPATSSPPPSPGAATTRRQSVSGCGLFRRGGGVNLRAARVVKSSFGAVQRTWAMTGGSGSSSGSPLGRVSNMTEVFLPRVNTHSAMQASSRSRSARHKTQA